jgi:hypothetical protein
VNQKILDKLAHEIALEDSLSTIDGQCVAPLGYKSGWRDSKDSCPGAQRYVERAIKYLDARGLLIRNKNNPDWVKPKENPHD